MSVFERFTCDDLFHCNGVNLDPLTENVCYVREVMGLS